MNREDYRHQLQIALIINDLQKNITKAVKFEEEYLRDAEKIIPGKAGDKQEFVERCFERSLSNAINYTIREAIKISDLAADLEFGGKGTK